MTLHKPMLGLLWVIKLAAILFISGILFAVFWLATEFDEPAHPFIILWTAVLPALTILLCLTLAEIYLFIWHQAVLTIPCFLLFQVIASVLWLLDPLLVVLIFGSSRPLKNPPSQDPISYTQAFTGACLLPFVISLIYAGTLYSTLKKDGIGVVGDEEARETDPLVQSAR